MIQITLNHTPLCLAPPATAASALQAAGLCLTAGLSLSLNGTPVPPAAWSVTPLHEGDELTTTTNI